ncbi:MAG: S-layer homology domain-containing protein, partial [Clostridiales bacterium]|nr:S-layer homology domain-containing protein [Clostridiales bacterium]
NLTWTLENGILTISGSGEMDNWDDYTNTNAPWYADYNDIIGVVIENGVTSIGSSAFIDLTDCKSFSIGADVQSIGKRAFSSLSSNTKIKFNGNAPSIDTSAFADDLDGIDIYYNSEKGDWEKVIAQEYESIPSIAWIYSEDATENLAIENTLRFPNEATYFGGEENGYYISKNDYQTLLSNLNSKDKKAIESKKNINGEKNVYFYNVDRGTSSHFTWGGSCYGMSVLIALVNGGILSLSDFNTSADTLFAVDSTAETQSIINFYQGQQLLPFVTGIQAEFMTQQEQPAQIKKMEELVTDAQANGSVALISFAYKDETGQATRRDHTILGYAVERGTFKLQINDTPYLFDRRILTYDPAYSGDHQQYHNGAIYYNDTQWAMIGLYNVVSSTNGFNLNSESDTAQLKLVITDTNYINAVDYVTGETNFNSVAKNAYLYTGNSDFIVESIWGVDTVKNGLFDGAATIADNGAVIIGMDADTGNSGTMPFTVAFPHLDSTYTVTTANDTVDFALAYENYYLSANSDQPGTVTFEPNGKVIMTTDQTGTGYLSITANDGCSSLPWHTLDIVSKDTSKLAFELTDTGILVAGDTLTDVTIYGTNDEETTELTFSTKAHSVLVASENNELVISEIPDKNSSSNSNNSTSSAFNPISISTSSNGTVSVNPKSAKAGNTVTITVVPDDGYGLDKLTVTDKNGSDIKLTDQGNGVYTFTMPDSEVFVTASFTELELPTLVLPFTDVTTSDWFYDAVAYAYDNSLMTGTSATTFSPNATTTRGMIVTILHRLEGSPAAEASGFADVESGAWYQAAVDWAAANGIVSGTSQTTFAPTDPITREQMAAILYRYASFKGYDVTAKADLAGFTDAAQISAYAKDAMAWANKAGLIGGVSATTLQPQGSATRAQVATILMRFCENVAK